MINVALASADRKFSRELRLQLVGWGYRPWMADPEEPLLEQLQDRGADLLLFDFTSPPSDALSAVRSLKRDAELKHIAVVAIVDPRDATSLDFSVGLEDFLVKTDSFEELETRIKFVLWRLSKVDSKILSKPARWS
jgi:DNA-binding response OmpR family regulator